MPLHWKIRLAQTFRKQLMNWFSKRTGALLEDASRNVIRTSSFRRRPGYHNIHIYKLIMAQMKLEESLQLEKGYG